MHEEGAGADGAGRASHPLWECPSIHGHRPREIAIGAVISRVEWGTFHECEKIYIRQSSRIIKIIGTRAIK
jgi:hypothetical protein